MSFLCNVLRLDCEVKFQARNDNSKIKISQAKHQEREKETQCFKKKISTPRPWVCLVELFFLYLWQTQVVRRDL